MARDVAIIVLLHPVLSQGVNPMSRIKTRVSSAIFLFCLASKALASSCESCEPGASCLPCGYELGGANTLAPGDPSINPMINYVATVESNLCRGYFSGFYVGAAYGAGITNFDYRIAGRAPFMLDKDKRSYLVGIFDAGFNLVFDYFLLGVEGSYNYRSRSNPISFNTEATFSLSSAAFAGVPFVVARSYPCRLQVDIESQHAVAADLLPGFAYDRFTAYLRLGVEETKYKWHRTITFPKVAVNTAVVPSIIGVINQDFIESQSKSENGYRAGLGFGYAVGPHVSFHLNFIHIFTQKISVTPRVLPTTLIAPDLTVSPPLAATPSQVAITELAAANTFEPQRNEVNVGVRFRF